MCRRRAWKVFSFIGLDWIVKETLGYTIFLAFFYVLVAMLVLVVVLSIWVRPVLLHPGVVGHQSSPRAMETNTGRVRRPHTLAGGAQLPAVTVRLRVAGLILAGLLHDLLPGEGSVRPSRSAGRDWCRNDNNTYDT